MNNLRNLVSMLERKFRHSNEGKERLHILELLSIYYPILQSNMKFTVEITQSKINFEKLKKECLHLETTKDSNFKYVHKCNNCGKTIYK